MFIYNKDIEDYEDDWNKIDEINNRPNGYPLLKIDEAMAVYNKTIYFGHSNLEDKLDDIKESLKELDKDSKVFEYIDLKHYFDFLARAHIPLDKKTSHLQKRMCNHPLFGVLDRKAICTVCGRKFDFSFEELQELIDSKKLIADGIALDGDDLYPIKKDSLKSIREHYLEEYINNKDNVEQSVWDYFCGNNIIISDEVDYIKIKKIGYSKTTAEKLRGLVP